MQPGRSWCGLILAGAAGALLDHAWNLRTGDPWVTGALTATSGVLLLASALVLARGQSTATGQQGAALDKAESLENPPFLLGDLLVNRFSLVTYDQLAQGLARQRGTSKRIGEVLVEMGFLTEDDLEMVLEEQRLLRTVWQQLNVTAGGSPSAEHGSSPPTIRKWQSESDPAA